MSRSRKINRMNNNFSSVVTKTMSVSSVNGKQKRLGKIIESDTRKPMASVTTIINDNVRNFQVPHKIARNKKIMEPSVNNNNNNNNMSYPVSRNNNNNNYNNNNYNNNNSFSYNRCSNAKKPLITMSSMNNQPSQIMPSLISLSKQPSSNMPLSLPMSVKVITLDGKMPGSNNVLLKPLTKKKSSGKRKSSKK